MSRYDYDASRQVVIIPTLTVKHQGNYYYSDRLLLFPLIKAIIIILTGSYHSHSYNMHQGNYYYSDRADFREMIQMCYPTASAERLEGSVFK